MHWHRMYALPFQRRFHLSVPSYFIKDDHDTLKNDCWPGQNYGQLTFAQAPSPEALMAEVEGPGFETLPPASMVLLVAAFSRVDYPAGWDRVCRDGLLRFPDHYRLVESCAYAFRRQGRWVEAARLYTAVASLRPEIAGLWRSLGIALVRIDDPEGGVAALRRAVRLDPEAARNHLDLARALDASGEPR